MFVVPGTTAYFAGFELGKYVSRGQGSATQDFVAGVTAQLCCGLIFTPMDVLKEKCQAATVLSNSHHIPGVRDLFFSLGPRGLMRGYWISSVLWVPWSATYSTAYGQLKSWARSTPINGCHSEQQAKLEHGEMSPAKYALCAGLAASIASALTHPIDVIKTRVQVLSGPQGSQHRHTVGACIASLWASEGLRGFWRGFGMRLGLMAPQTSISWMTYETISNWLTECH